MRHIRLFTHYLTVFLVFFLLVSCSSSNNDDNFVTESSDATLSALSISQGVLTPDFQADVLTYNVSVGFSTTSVTINPTSTHNNASIDVDGNAVDSGTDSPAIALATGDNTVVVTVTAEDGVTTKLYRVLINKAATASTDATLSAFSITQGTLTPNFQPDILDYAASVGFSISSIEVTATTNNANASIVIDGNAVNSGDSSSAITLDIGSNTIDVTVTAEDGTTSESYTLVVTRIAMASNDASLSGLTISVGAFNELFQSNVLAYTSEVDSSVASISVTADSTGVNASIETDGVAVASGAASQPIALSEGLNTIDVVVTAEDGVTKSTYTLSVTRVPGFSTDATLSNITVSDGELAPGFQSNTADYSIAVDSATDTIEVTIFINDPNASADIDGVAANTGSASAPIALSEGVNSITITVTAEDGVTTMDYSLTVTRAGSSGGAILSDLVVSVGASETAPLDPPFSSDGQTFEVNVGNATSVITITATSPDPNAQLSFNAGTGDFPLVSGQESGPIFLQEGTTFISVTVIPEDISGINSYSLAITRAVGGSTDASLSGLFLSSGLLLDPLFNQVVTAYNVDVDILTTHVSVLAKASNANANVTINGTPINTNVVPAAVSIAATSTCDQGVVSALEVGTNNLDVTVTAEDGISTENYALTITQSSSAEFMQRAYLKACNMGSNDFFGFSTDISGNTMVIGAYEEKGNGIDENDDSVIFSGAAYVFVRDVTTGLWKQQAYLKASNVDERDEFGYSVAIDGDTLVVGARAEDSSVAGGEADDSLTNAGAAYVFKRDAGIWTQQAFLKAGAATDRDQFGESVAIHADTIVVGANKAADFSVGRAYVFTRDNSDVWTEQDTLIPSDGGGDFGISVALHDDTVVVGAWGAGTISRSGTAYVFTRSSNNWAQQKIIKASNAGENDLFGRSISLSLTPITSNRLYFSSWCSLWKIVMQMESNQTIQP